MGGSESDGAPAALSGAPPALSPGALGAPAAAAGTAPPVPGANGASPAVSLPLPAVLPPTFVLGRGEGASSLPPPQWSSPAETNSAPSKRGASLAFTESNPRAPR